MEKQIFPEIKVFRLGDVAEFIGKLARGGVSRHQENTGASVMLDEALDNQPQLPFEDGGRWSDMGTY